MKVAYITNSSGSLGGATKALLQLVNELARYGVEPLIVLPDTEGIYSDLKKKGIKVYALNYRMNIYPPLRGLKDFLFFIPRSIGRFMLTRKTANRLAAILKENEIQLVHSNSSVVEIGRLAAAKLNIPHIYHVREYGDADFKMHYIPSKSYAHLMMRQSNTICITEGIQKHHGLDKANRLKGRSVVIYDGVLPQQSVPTFSEKGNYFLFAGRLEPAKGLDFMLKGYCEYVKSTSTPLPLKVAGHQRRPGYLAMIKEYIHQNGLDAHVELLGPRSDIFDLMKEAKAIVIASPFEGFGFCMVEAMFNGCLVIGRDLTGTHEQFEKGLEMQGVEIGLRYKTTEELTHILQEVGHSPITKYLEMKKRAFVTVNTLYTSEHCADQVYQFYKTLI
ncbi:MAG: glycosyltransferase [Bacteroidaceae bacterium]|nr:glycosyltransferase [Bacteroidaceae bacterium]